MEIGEKYSFDFILKIIACLFFRVFVYFEFLDFRNVIMKLEVGKISKRRKVMWGYFDILFRKNEDFYIFMKDKVKVILSLYIKFKN